MQDRASNSGLFNFDSLEYNTESKGQVRKHKAANF